MRVAVILLALSSVAHADITSEKVMAAPDGAKITGKVVLGKRFTDKNGENVVVVTHNGKGPDEQLYVFHFAKSEGAWKLLRKLSDGVSDCQEDVVLAPVGDIDVTDLDKDGIAEATLSYTVGCRGDMSPVAMKLMLLENGDKYAMRGEQEMYVQHEDHSLTLDNPWPTKPPEWEPKLDKAHPFRVAMQARWNRDKKWIFAKEKD